MKNQDADLDVQSEDWDRQSSEPTDLEMEYRENRVKVDERIKAIQDQLIRQDERMTRIENDVKSISTGLIKVIQDQLRPYEARLTRIDDSWKSSVKWWIMFTLGVVAIMFTVFGLTNK